MKTFLPWILVVAFAAGAGALYFSNSSQRDELNRLRDQAKQADALSTQADDLQKQLAAQNDQIASLQKDNAELLRLRNQVRQLGDEKAALAKQLQVAQSQADRSQEQIQQVQARSVENAKQMAEQQILQARQNQATVGVCINNLRLIDGAKQQWATEHQKGPDAVPLPQEIVPYFPNGQMPMCPGAGAIR